MEGTLPYRFSFNHFCSPLLILKQDLSVRKTMMLWAYFSFQSDDMSETSTDVSNSLHPASILPGFKSSFIAVGRNMKQWRQCVSINEGKQESLFVLQSFPTLLLVNSLAI